MWLYLHIGYNRVSGVLFIYLFKDSRKIKRNISRISRKQKYIYNIHNIRLNIYSANYFNCVIPKNKYLSSSNNYIFYFFLINILEHPEKPYIYSTYKVTHMILLANKYPVEQHFTVARKPLHQFSIKLLLLISAPFLEDSKLSHSKSTPLIITEKAYQEFYSSMHTQERSGRNIYLIIWENLHVLNTQRQKL